MVRTLFEWLLKDKRADAAAAVSEDGVRPRGAMGASDVVRTAAGAVRFLHVDRLAER